MASELRCCYCNASKRKARLTYDEDGLGLILCIDKDACLARKAEVDGRARAGRPARARPARPRRASKRPVAPAQSKRDAAAKTLAWLNLADGRAQPRPRPRARPRPKPSPVDAPTSLPVGADGLCEGA